MSETSDYLTDLRAKYEEISEGLTKLSGVYLDRMLRLTFDPTIVDETDRTIVGTCVGKVVIEYLIHLGEQRGTLRTVGSADGTLMYSTDELINQLFNRGSSSPLTP